MTSESSDQRAGNGDRDHPADAPDESARRDAAGSAADRESGGGEPASRATDANREETQKSYRTILAQEIEEGLVEIDRPVSGQFISGLSAGLDIGFGPFFLAVLLAIPRDGLSAPLFDLLAAGAYAVGFVFVVLGQSDLFTEHTTLAVLPVLHGRASYASLLYVWAIVYAGNIVGATVFTVFAAYAGLAIDAFSPAALAELSRGFVEYSTLGMLLSAVLAGWLMGLLSWLVRASRDTVTILLVVLVVAGGIGFAHLPHSIAGTVEVGFGVVTGEVALVEFARFLVVSTIGNTAGGVVFVALVKHSHAMRGGAEPESVTVESVDDQSGS